MTATAPPLLDDPSDLSALRAKGADPDELFASFAAWAEASGTVLYPAQEEALIELVSGANVVLATPTGSGKSLVATGALYAALAAGRRSYYTAPIKALVSEKFFALCDVFGAANVGMLTGDAAVNAGAPIIACTAEVLANIALREGARRRHRPGGDGRVPLLRRPRPRLGLAGAAAGAAEGAVPADVGHARRRHVPPRGPHPPHRPADGAGRQRRAPGAAAPLLRDHADARDDRRPARHEAGADLRRPLHPGLGAGAGAGADERQREHQGGEGRDRRHDRRVPVLLGLRDDAVATGPARDRRSPRRDAAQVPAAGGTAGPGRPAQGHLRHRHPRRRHQRADPDRRLLGAVEVRRHPHPAAQRPRVPPDRRAGRAGRLRHRGHRRRPGARPRGGEPQTVRQGRRRPEEAPKAGAPQGARGHGAVERVDHDPAGRGRPRAADQQHAGVDGDDPRRRRPSRRPVRRDAPAAHREPRAAQAAAAAHPRGGRHRPLAAAGRRPRAARRTRRRRTALPTDRRPAARLRPQPAAVDVRARRGRRARPGIGNLCAGRRFGHRGDPRGPPPDPGGAAEQGQGRGRGRR